MKKWNLFFRSLLSWCLVTSPLVVYSEDPGAAAIQFIQESHKAARKESAAYVKEDFYKLVDRLSEEMENYANSRELYQTYKKYLSELEAEFGSLSAESFSSGEQTFEKLDQFIQRYETAIRKQFVASWIPSEQQKQYAQARLMIEEFSKSFQRTCERGRSKFEGVYDISGIQTPEHFSSLNGKVDFSPLGLLSGGSPLTWNYSYVDGTAGSKAANHDRAVAVNTVVTASNLANSMWLSSKFVAMMSTTGSTASVSSGGTGMMATVNSTMVAAAPYLLAASAIVMLTVYFMSQAEAAKFAKKVVDANTRMAREAPDHLDFQKYYKDTCDQYLEVLNQLIVVFQDLDNEEKRVKRLEESNLLSEEIAVWETESPKQGFFLCQVQLNERYENYGCTQIKKEDSPERLKQTHVFDPKKPESFCFINTEKTGIKPYNNACALPIKDKDRSALVTSAQKSMYEYNAKYPIETVINYMAANLAIEFADQQELQSKIRRVSTEHIENVQERAFQNLVRYIRIVKHMQDGLGKEDALSAEAAIQTNYFYFKRELIALGDQCIDVIFGRMSLSKLKSDMAEYQLRLKPFVRKYRHVNEIKELGQTANFVANELRQM